MRLAISVLAVCLGLTSVSVLAATPRLKKPTGPVTITADNAEWEEGVMVYSGNVVMNSRAISLRGARLELRQPAGSKAPYIITLNGSPAHFVHAAELANDPPVNAKAQTIVYKSAGQEIDLKGNAELTRGKDLIKGETVHYSVQQRRVKASGGAGGQVTFVIDVPEGEDAITP